MAAARAGLDNGWVSCHQLFPEGVHTKSTVGVYRVIDVVAVSEKSWEDAGRQAVETAAESLRDLRVAEVTQMDMKVEKGKVVAFRTRVSLSFKDETQAPGSSRSRIHRERARPRPLRPAL